MSSQILEALHVYEGGSATTLLIQISLSVQNLNYLTTLNQCSIMMCNQKKSSDEGKAEIRAISA